MIFFSLFSLYSGISAWSVPSSLQQILPDSAPSLMTAVRFDKGSDCENFIKKLHWRHSIVYNYGLDENNTGARQLVNCLSKHEATGPRSTIKEIYVAVPVIGIPRPKQRAFLELIELLPNLETIKYFVHPVFSSYCAF